jgi:hypothetical protein
MKELLLIEKSKYQIKPSSDEDKKYTFEGVFTEFDSENRNGRVYTKKEFQPHFEALKKVVEAGKCLGELDHPKQFETSLKNVSHIVEKVWMDEANNRVMGRIKLLDTDAGKQAKALVDAGVPLHISSRAAGTVTENKTVKIHKLFTYDLVDTPGFENAVMNSVNESYGFDSIENEDYSSFLIYEINKQTNEFTKSVNTSELNNKNKTENVENKIEYIKENEFNGFSEYTKGEINEMKSELADLRNIQESIIKQNDHMVDEFNKGIYDKNEEIIESLTKKIEAIEKWADHVVAEFKIMKESHGAEKELEDSVPAKFEVGKSYKDYGTVRAIQNSEDGGVEVWFDDEDEPVFFPVKESVEVMPTNKGKESKVEKDFGKKTTDLQVGDKYKGGTITAIQRTEDGQIKIFLDATDEPIVIGKADGGVEDITLEEKVDMLLKKFHAIEKWSSHVTETVTALENWSDHATETVSAVEKWSEHVTETVSAVEKWSEHVTESVTGIEKWAEHATDSVTKLEESLNEGTSQVIKESKDIEDFKSSIFERIESIVDAKKQGAETLNESKVTEKIEKVEESEKPLWLEQLPAKYEQTWESLAESEKAKIAKRAELREFKTSSAIREFWNVTFTKENLIKEEPKKLLTEQQLSDRRQAIIESYRANFGR